MGKIIPMACDHAGFELKEFLKSSLIERGLEIKDFGTYTSDSVDYPDMIHPLAKEINEQKRKANREKNRLYNITKGGN